MIDSPTWPWATRDERAKMRAIGRVVLQAARGVLRGLIECVWCAAHLRLGR